MSRKQRTWGLALSFALIALIAVAGVIPSSGGKNSRVRLNRESSEPDQEHPTRRQAWFMAGRTALGQNIAALRFRALQQRQAMHGRAVKLSVSRITPFGNPTPTPTWGFLGPTNLTSDPTNPPSQSYGVVTGRATSVAIDQSDASGNTVYVGGAFGGVWKSTNAVSGAPAGWTAVVEASNLGFTDSIGAIAIQPGNTPSTALVLVGTGETNSSADSYYGQGILVGTSGGTNWSLIQSADAGAHTFQGLGFSKITFSASNHNNVVAAAASSNFGFTETSGQANAITRGLYFSTNANLGATMTWSLGCVTDSASPCAQGLNSIFPGSATDVVFNASNNTFYALIRAHGMYQSTDGGATWTRLSPQPITGLSIANCPSTTSNLTTCPLYRGHIAVRPGTNEMYVAFVDANENFQGIFRTTDGGAHWSNDLGETGYSSCGDSAGCGAPANKSQESYNMYLSAVINGSTGTDLYLGGINIYRCHLATNTAASCTWQNLTHVYGCNPTAAPSNVHPDQHAMDFVAGNSNIMYFANDGGLYASDPARGIGGVTGTCTSDATLWRNMNGTLGPMTEFVWFSQDVTNPAIVMGGTQDNGSPCTNGSSWDDCNNGDGGYNDIDPTNTQIWYTSNTDVSVQQCTTGDTCNFAAFPLIVDNCTDIAGGCHNNIGGDQSSFYTPFMLDPRDHTKVIIGTCRVWRGSSSNASAWPGTNNANALSFNFDSNMAPATTCGSSNVMISALAAGGPPAPSGSSAVIYAGREDGKIFVSTAAESGPSSFNDRSISLVTGGCPFSSATGGCKISSIVVDTTDATGNTAVATVMGFGVGHVWRTTNAGVSWANIDNGGLPDSPANSVIVDPFDSTHIFVGNDVGVFETLNQGGTWTEFGTGFPTAPATRLLLFDGNGTRHLRASTYGRGIWDVQMASVAFFSFQAPSGASQTIAAGQTATYNLTISSNNNFSGSVTFTCAGAPGGATCAVNGGNPLNLTTSSTNVPFTVTVTNTQSAGVAPSGLRGWPMAFAAILVGLLIGAARKPKQAFPVALAVLVVGGMLSCGGGGGGNPTPTPTPKPNTNATLSVTGTSGVTNRSISLSLTVTH